MPYCFADTVFIPEANVGIKLRSLKDFYLDKPDVKVHGPDVDSCSAVMLVGKLVTDAPDSVEVTSESFEVKDLEHMYLCVSLCTMSLFNHEEQLLSWHCNTD